jgi:hypothetical protein
MLIDFDSRCRTIEELCQKGKSTLDALVQDLSRTPNDLNTVKKLVTETHKARYTIAWDAGESATSESLKQFIFNTAKTKIVKTKTQHQQIITDLTEKIKKLEDLKLKYRYTLGLVKQTNFLNEVTKTEYIAALKDLYKFVNTKDNCPCNLFEKHKDLMCKVFRQYFTLQQAIAQAIFIIYAHVERYAPHYLRSTQDRINHYAIMAREWVNCRLKCELVTKELQRIETLKEANGINDKYDPGDTPKCDINKNREDAVKKIIEAYNDLMNKDTQDLFKKFTTATRLNVISHDKVVTTLTHLGDFQQGLNKYAQEVAKETNLFAEIAAQKSSACKTKTKLNMECLFADCQLTMIEMFSLPVRYKNKDINARIGIPEIGLYPEHPNDQKTNFDFIRFLCRRMLENERSIPKLLIVLGKETEVEDAIRKTITRGEIIRGGDCDM